MPADDTNPSDSVTPPTVVNPKFLRRVRRKDRIAKAVIHFFGMGIILVVLLIVFIIGSISLPLFAPVKSAELANFKLPAEIENPVAVGIDEYLETAFAIDNTGDFVFFDTLKGTYIDTVETPGDQTLRRVTPAGQDRFHLLWEDGAAATIAVKFTPSFVQDEEGNQIRTIEHRLATEQRWPAKKAITHTLSAGNSETKIRVDQREGGGFDLYSLSEEEDFLGNVEKTEKSGSITNAPVMSQVLVSRDGKALYGANGSDLYRFNISNVSAPKQMDKLGHGHEITALAFVNGEVSVVVADADGGVSTYMPVEIEPGSPRQLQLIHRLRKHGGSVDGVFTATRNKTILSYTDTGIHADYMTSERELATFPGEGVAAASLAPRGDGLIALLGDGTIRTWSFTCKHPEVNTKTLFGKVHYENYAEPVYEWQSSSGDNSHEPKLSLIPLISGTLKATLFAMLFSIPIAILAALYSSQFMNPKWRNTIKPSVEIMAAVPSVVVGFLAAYWLAPILYNNMVSFFLSLVVLPIVLITVVLLWRKFGPRTTPGKEFLVLLPVVIIGAALSFGVGSLIESVFMTTEYYPRGNFAQWLNDVFSTPLDQRNAILIAFALGFAVMPIIFTLADDALSSVPRGLSAASLALGADRWQTAWKVVLPSASPGIFAAVMIGFGRAIGETMIVLMAAGNVPVLGFNPFNGMRTMSANIATEMPEAAVNSTHYRVLFLSAVLLFGLTFLINTVAEVVRMRLRKKYGNY